MTGADVPVAPRSWLLVPADDEAKVRAALESGADALILDLESSVDDERKTYARDLLRGHFGVRSPDVPQSWVRINRLDSVHYGADLTCCEDLGLDGLVLPEAENGDEVRRLTADTVEAGWQVHAMVAETAAGLFQLDSFRESSPALAAMSWGIDDLAVALGASTKFEDDGSLGFTFRVARSLCLAAARAAGVQPVDAVHRDLVDSERLRRDSEAARREGFTGKLAVDPAQVPVINAAFVPAPDEVTAAQRIVEAFDAEPGTGVLAVGARVIDRTRLRQAQSVLARARHAGA